MISTFLITFLIVVGAWLLPDWMPYKNNITVYTWPIMLTTGWSQFWTLFCPEPRDLNYHLTAVIEFADGTLKCYEFPRMETMDLVTKFRREKMRKLFGDNIAWPGFAQFRPSVCRYLARANNDSENHPVKITMIRNIVNTPPPDPKHWVYRDNLPQHIRKEILFSYHVTTQDLSQQ